MLIVCPNCSTSYMVDPTALGPGGRTVRCARCKITWFASWQKEAPDAKAFMDGAIAEAEGHSAPAEPPPPIMPPAANIPERSDEFGAEPAEPAGEAEAEPHLPTESDGSEWQPATQEHAPEPVAVEDAPSLVPPADDIHLDDHLGDHLGEPDAADTESEDVESYAVRRKRLQARRREARRSSRWTAVILVLFAFNVAVIGARNEVVRYLPQTASLFAAIGLPVNLRELSFENVRITKRLQDGVSILVVEGTIVSTADKPVKVPRLRFAARDAAGQEIYTWTALPSRSILKPGEKLDFDSRLASPPANAKTVMVRFFNARDAAAAAK
jgi:predicted Zn finger-like uncharacterized protein